MYDLNNRCTVTNQTDLEEVTKSSLIMMHFFFYDLWAEELAVKFAFYEFTHNYYTMVTEMLTILLGDWSYLTKP